jgi:CheY-like chemotaxis protein
MVDYPVVLCVDDDPLSRKIMQMLLQGRMKLAHVTLWADSVAFDTKLAALTPRPDLIILDIQVLPYTGYEMLAMARSLEGFQRTPIIAVTASVMNEEVFQLRAAGFNGCIAKPIKPDTFPDTLQRILDGETVWRI